MDPFSAEGGQSSSPLSPPRPHVSTWDVPLFTLARPPGDVTYKVDIRILFAAVCSIAFVWQGGGLSWNIAIATAADSIIVAMSLRRDAGHDRSSSPHTWDFPLFAVVRPSGDVTYNTDKRILFTAMCSIVAVWYGKGLSWNLAIAAAGVCILVAMTIRKDEGHDRYRRVERALRR